MREQCANKNLENLEKKNTPTPAANLAILKLEKSEDLNNELVRYTNSESVSGCQMFNIQAMT